MKTKIFAPVHPQTLHWIRIELGLSLETIAKKTNFSVENLQKWEEGTEKLTLSQTKKIAKIYKVSVAFLYQKQTPDEHHFKSIVDFRRASSRYEPFSDRLHLAIRKAHFRQTWMSEFLQSENKQPLDWLGCFSNNDNFFEIAEKCKNWLNIEQEKIKILQDDKEAFDYWVEKIEGKGVIVASNHTHSAYKIDREEYSGIVLYDEYAPLILLNPKDKPSRKIFTLLHELAHLLIKPESCLSAINFRTNEDEYDELEVFCNNIASAVLIDKNIVNKSWQQQTSESDNIEILTKKFKVSYSAVAVALKKYDIINQETLNQLLDFYKTKFQENESKSKGGKTIPDKQVLDRCGKLLTTQVLSAYEQGTIDSLEVYDVLGMKLKYLNKLSDRLQFPLSRWVS